MIRKNSTPKIFVLFFSILMTICSTSVAWSIMECKLSPGSYQFYTNNRVWPLLISKNLPAGHWTRDAIEDAMALWNGVYGADDVLKIAGDEYPSCYADEGTGTIAWDDGTCTTWPSNEPGSVTLGLSIKSYSSIDCEISASTIYFNKEYTGWTQEKLTSVAAHELGHYLLYAHNWYAPSIMGYTYTNAEPLTFLTAEDHAFMRYLYDSGNAADVNLHIHRYVLVSELGRDIVPDQISYTNSPEPTCSSGCENLSTGDTISVILTYANTSNTDATEPIRIGMYLDDTQIGEWRLSNGLAAEHWGTGEFEGTVNSSVSAGDHVLKVIIDPDYQYGSGSGPSAQRSVQFSGFKSCNCSSGACCDGCGYRSSGTVCDTNADVEYRCSGSFCGADVEQRTQVQYCSGSSASCDGETEWRSWTTAEYCGSGELCISNGSTSAFCSSCDHGCENGRCCKCASGDCCDGCEYRSSSSVCEESSNVEYRCNGSGCGADAEKRTQKTYCSGSSASCSGRTEWNSWTVVESCSSNQICKTNQSSYSKCETCSEGCSDGVCIGSSSGGDGDADADGDADNDPDGEGSSSDDDEDDTEGTGSVWWSQGGSSDCGCVTAGHGTSRSTLELIRRLLGGI